jgi:DNA-binding NarL/FixJ family response regulator
MFAELLAEALAAEGHEVVGTCGTLDDALRTVAAGAPDLVVLDHNLPAATGTSGIAAVKRSAPGTRVLMLTAVQERAVLLDAMDAGADGFVTKRQNLSEVRAAVAAVLRGETPVSSDMVGGLVARRPMPVGGDLSSREADVLQLIGAGMSNRDIGAELRISVNTVRNHVQRVLTKLGAHSKLEALAVASRLDLLRTDRGRG